METPQDIKSIIAEALKCLEEADFVGYFETLQKVKMPSSFKTNFSTYKQEFQQGLKEFTFNQRLALFAKELERQTQASLNHLLEDQLEIDEYLNQTHILVISKEASSDTSFLVRFFEKFRFKNVAYCTEAEYQIRAAQAHFELHLFNNEEGEFKDLSLLTGYLKKDAPNLAYLYFGRGFLTTDAKNINFASSRYTLYEQIMNLLKIHKMLF